MKRLLYSSTLLIVGVAVSLTGVGLLSERAFACENFIQVGRTKQCIGGTTSTQKRKVPITEVFKSRASYISWCTNSGEGPLSSTKCNEMYSDYQQKLASGKAKIARCSSARKRMRSARRDYWEDPSISNFEYMESAIDSAYDPDCL